MLTEFEAIQWCKQNHAKVEWLERDVSVDAPGFDTIVAETVQSAVEMAIELENETNINRYKSLAQHAQIEGRSEEADAWERLVKAEERRLAEQEPDWLPNAAELDELEESLQAGKEMIEDETRAIKAELTNGAFFL